MPISIAIDGPAGAGKSTVARAVAARIGAIYLDTGAMYRAVSLYMVRAGVDPDDAAAVAARAGEARVTVCHDADGSQRVCLNGEDVSQEIRTQEISWACSRVAAVPGVREAMVAMQRAIAAGTDIVMDGRDIGTQVLPSATLKVYLVADVSERARRRHEELAARGGREPYAKVLEDLLQRDRNDSTRAVSPLRKASDAVELDTTHLSVEEAVEAILAMLAERSGRSGALQGGRV